MKPSHRLDVTGLQCPLPVLKAQKLLRDLQRGEALLVLATDPISKVDIPHYCHQSGNELLWSDQVDDVLRFAIKKC